MKNTGTAPPRPDGGPVPWSWRRKRPERIMPDRTNACRATPAVITAAVIRENMLMVPP